MASSFRQQHLDQSADYVVLKRNLNGHGGRAWLATDKVSEHNPRKNQKNHAFYVPKVTGKCIMISRRTYNNALWIVKSIVQSCRYKYVCLIN